MRRTETPVGTAHPTEVTRRQFFGHSATGIGTAALASLLATDFAIAAEDTVFSLSEVNWGILPGALVAKVREILVVERPRRSEPHPAARSSVSGRFARPQ